MENPAWKAIEISFLFFVMVHALTGSYAVLTDYDFLARYKKVFAPLLILAGMVAFYWGATTVLSW
jgi:succinate dehydrogenase hydrophobic anchor subunit